MPGDDEQMSSTLGDLRVSYFAALDAEMSAWQHYQSAIQGYYSSIRSTSDEDYTKAGEQYRATLVATDLAYNTWRDAYGRRDECL